MARPLHLATCAGEASPDRDACLTRVRANRDRLKELAEHAPTNFLHKVTLVEAEYLRVTGEDDPAGAYDHALELALRIKPERFPQRDEESGAIA